MWQVINSGHGSACKNMDIDRFLFKNFNHSDVPILHFYEWERPSATYGYFINYSTDLIDCARSPTGGGIVFHINDLSFSVLIPKKHRLFIRDTMKNYSFLHANVLQAIQSCSKNDLHLMKNNVEEIKKLQNFCFAKPVQNDIMLLNKKIAGGAIRKNSNGFLYQGSIAIAQYDFDAIGKLVDLDTVEAMKLNGGFVDVERKDLIISLQETFQNL